MKRVMKDKKVMSTIAVLVLAVALLASGVIASPPTGSGDPPVESKINYQGQLTDDAGDPLNGTYDMGFLFYDSAIGGSQVGSTITENDVEVTDGLFSVKLDVDQADFDGQGLWLEVMVEGETLSPRQEILPVPYALSLKPGADIKGGTDNTIVKAENTGLGDAVLGIASGYDSIGVHGQSGFGTGVRGEGEVGVSGESSVGPGVEGSGSVGVYGMSDSGIGVCGYSDSGAAISASGTGVIESTADSYIFISGNDFVKTHASETTTWDCASNGGAYIRRGTTGSDKYIFIPITVPGVLYGQEVTVKELTIYYKCQDGTKNYIFGTYFFKQTDADSYVTIGSESTDRTSDTATSYTLSLTTNNILSSDQGILGLYLGLHFDDDSNYILIGGVRLRLGHD
jgi:hypothetical protein